MRGCSGMIPSMQFLMDLINTYSVATWILIAAAAFGTAAFHAVAGLGGVLLLSALLTPLMGVKLVIPVLSVAAILGNGTRLVLFRNAVQWWAVRAVMLTALPAIIVGAFLYTRLPSRSIAFVMGVFLILSVPARRWLKSREFVVGKAGLSGVGLVFGLFGGTVIGAGLILGPFLLGANILSEALIGTVAGIGLILNITKSTVFGSTTLITLEHFIIGLGIGLCMIPGAWTGRWIVRNTPIRLHTVFVECLIVAGGLFFLYQALGAD